jgi:hypothetical protein
LPNKYNKFRHGHRTMQSKRNIHAKTEPKPPETEPNLKKMPSAHPFLFTSIVKAEQTTIGIICITSSSLNANY